MRGAGRPQHPERGIVGASCCARPFFRWLMTPWGRVLGSQGPRQGRICPVGGAIGVMPLGRGVGQGSQPTS